MHSPPDLDPIALSDDRLADPPAHPTIGRVNTPPDIARSMAREAVAAIAGTVDGLPTIVEPAAGSGVIVAALIEAFARTRTRLRAKPATALKWIRAIDRDPGIRQSAARRLSLLCGSAANRWAQQCYDACDALLEPRLHPKKPIDLVIGNPPYLGVRHARRLADYERWRRRFGVTEDVYAFFLRRAMEDVRPGGHVMLLVPDGWLSLPGYADLRQVVLSGRLKQVVRLPTTTFDKIVTPCYFLWQKTRPRGGNTRYIDRRSGKDEETRVKQEKYQALPGSHIFVPRRRACELAETLTRLEQSDEATTFESVATVADVGIHSRNCRHRLFFRTRSRAGLQRLLQGRQIEPFAVRWDSPRAQYRWVDINYVPDATIRGQRGNGQPSVRNEYWNWQGDPAIHRLPERILIRQTGDRIIAARCVQSKQAHYTDNTLFTCLPKDRLQAGGIGCGFLLAYLNASIVSEFYRFLSGEEGRPQAQLKIGLLRRLPFPWPSRQMVRRVEGCVEQLEDSRKRGRTATSIERRLDGMFSRLFASRASDIVVRPPRRSRPFGPREGRRRRDATHAGLGR